MNYSAPFPMKIEPFYRQDQLTDRFVLKDDAPIIHTNQSNCKSIFAESKGSLEMPAIAYARPGTRTKRPIHAKIHTHKTIKPLTCLNLAPPSLYLQIYYAILCKEPE